MIPFNRISPVDSADTFIHPWTEDFLTSFQWGPIQLQDPSQGLLIKLWEAYVVGKYVFIQSADNPPVLYYTHTHEISRISLAFNQNGDPHLAFFDVQQLSFLYWFNGLTSSMTLTQWPAGYIGPCVTLDDGRKINVSYSDVVFAYIRSGALRYRLQRDRFDIEYTPTIGEFSTIPASDLYHISMQVNYVVGFLLSTSDLYTIVPTNIMKKSVLTQKAAAEILPVTYDFNYLMAFGDTIVAAKSTNTLLTGEDSSPADMLDGDPSFTAHTVTQNISGGVVGNIYNLAICVRTSSESIYVIEGNLYINDSPAEAPAV